MVPTDQENERYGSWPLANIRMANALKLKDYDFHFSFGKGTHNSGQGAAEFPEEMIWLWRDYDPAKTEQTYEMEPSEKTKPVFRVSITNRELSSERNAANLVQPARVGAKLRSFLFFRSSLRGTARRLRRFPPSGGAVPLPGAAVTMLRSDIATNQSIARRLLLFCASPRVVA